MPTTTSLVDPVRPSLTISLADRLAMSSIPEASAGPNTTIKIQSNFAKGFVSNMQQMQTNFIPGAESFYVQGLDTTVYDAQNNIQ